MSGLLANEALDYLRWNDSKTVDLWTNNVIDSALINLRRQIVIPTSSTKPMSAIIAKELLFIARVVFDGEANRAEILIDRGRRRFVGLTINELQAAIVLTNLLIIIRFG